MAPAIWNGFQLKPFLKACRNGPSNICRVDAMAQWLWPSWTRRRFAARSTSGMGINPSPLVLYQQLWWTVAWMDSVDRLWYTVDLSQSQQTCSRNTFWGVAARSPCGRSSQGLVATGILFGGLPDHPCPILPLARKLVKEVMPVLSPWHSVVR